MREIRRDRYRPRMVDLLKALEESSRLKVTRHQHVCERGELLMSALGQKQTFRSAVAMSALPLIAAVKAGIALGRMLLSRVDKVGAASRSSLWRVTGLA